MLIAPHITQPIQNAQFNLGSVSISWEPATAVNFTDFDSEEQFRYQYDSDIDNETWLEIRDMLDDASDNNDLGGMTYIADLFTDPASKASNPPLQDGTNFSDALGVFTVTLISADSSGFEFSVVSETSGKNYKIVSGSPSGDIVVTLESQAEQVDSDFLTYDIEYTDDYREGNTVWSALKRRIPFGDTAFVWTVGQMIKSDRVCIRMRTKDMTSEATSPWSVGSMFSVNVFKLTAPAIVSPMSDILYSDFLMIILDESLTLNTFHQKVRYTLEYSSIKQNVGWTVIAQDIAPGQNMLRWNLDNVQSSDDYVLRLTAQNTSTSCTATVDNPDQIARSFVYNIRIQQSGMFIVDTMPPQAVLQMGNAGQVTNQLNQVLSIFAEDETTDVKQIQLRECDVGNSVLLGELPVESVDDIDTTDNGDLTDVAITSEQCPTPLSLLETRDFDKLITDSPVGNLSKMQWVFDQLDTEGKPVSAIKKIEALLTDMGGNTSLQDSSKVFMSIFDNNQAINDFAIVIEQREVFSFSDNATQRETAVYEVVYAGTSTGELWVLEPYARLLYTIADHPNILKIVEFNNLLYIFAYNLSTDLSAAYRHDGSEATLLNELNGVVTGVSEFANSLYIGLQSGDLWQYNGFSFSLKTTFNEPINTLYGDKNYLYIGFQNSPDLVLYNGTDFKELSVD